MDKRTEKYRRRAMGNVELLTPIESTPPDGPNVLLEALSAEKKRKTRRDYLHIFLFSALGIVCFALGYTTAWNDANAHWGRVYRDGIATIKQEISEEYGLREVEMPGIQIYDLVEGDDD